MRQLIDPKDTTRAEAFPLWSKSPQPMVTAGKTFDVTRLRKVSRRRGMKFNMLKYDRGHPLAYLAPVIYDEKIFVFRFFFSFFILTFAHLYYTTLQ